MSAVRIEVDDVVELPEYLGGRRVTVVLVDAPNDQWWTLDGPTPARTSVTLFGETLIGVRFDERDRDHWRVAMVPVRDVTLVERAGVPVGQS